jgi:RRXRR protein
MARVNSILSWTRRYGKLAPIRAIDVESVRFDTQLMQNPAISGIQYRQGTLEGYEVREYLLQKWGVNVSTAEKKSPAGDRSYHPKIQARIQPAQ